MSLAGVWGDSRDAAGVYGTSALFDGVHGVSLSAQHAGVSAINDGGGIGLYAQVTKGGVAGQFLGDVTISGALSLGNIAAMSRPLFKHSDKPWTRKKPK